MDFCVGMVVYQRVLLTWWYWPYILHTNPRHRFVAISKAVGSNRKLLTSTVLYLKGNCISAYQQVGVFHGLESSTQLSAHRPWKVRMTRSCQISHQYHHLYRCLWQHCILGALGEAALAALIVSSPGILLKGDLRRGNRLDMRTNNYIYVYIREREPMTSIVWYL